MSTNGSNNVAPPSKKQAEGVDAPVRTGSAASLSLLGEELLLSGAASAQDASAQDAPANHSSPEQNKKFGKPPRPSSFPSPNPPRRKTSTGGHRNVGSTGDYSFMSALTDGDDEQEPPDLRSRSVSFEQNFERRSSDDPLPSDLNGELPKPRWSQQPPVAAPSEAERVTKTNRHNRIASAPVAVSDVIGASPLEAEAETAILRILEEQEGDGRNSKLEDVVLPMFPKEALDSFAADYGPSDHSSKQSSANGIAQSSSKNMSPRSQRSENFVKTQDTATESAVDRKAENNAIQSSNLDTKLFGLTKAMNRLRALSEDARTKLSTDEHIPDSSRIADSIHYADPSDKGAADALVQNGNLLFRETMKNRQRGSRYLGRRGSQNSVTSSGIKHTSGFLEVHDELEDETDPAQDLEQGEVVPDVTKQAGWFQKRGGPVAKGTKNVVRKTKQIAKDDVNDVIDFLRPRKKSIISYWKRFFLFIAVPLVGIAALLFYVFDNPLAEDAQKKLNEDGGVISRDDGASVSWYLLFVVRQSLTFTGAKATEIFLIDYLTLRLRWTVRVFGSMLSLGLVQSKGFPFILTIWGAYNLCLLSGSNKFAQHWLFWQEAIDMFNDANPSGSLLTNSRYKLALGCGIAAGFIITWKRFWWGMEQGKRCYAHFGDEVAKMVEQMLLLGEVSNLGKQIESREAAVLRRADVPLDYYRNRADTAADDISGSPHSSPGRRSFRGDQVIDAEHRDKYTATLTQSQKVKLVQLLGQWEEPDIVTHEQNKISIKAILQFRETLTFMDSDYPFSVSFGRADRRETCVESAQEVYERLMLNNPCVDELPFETIATLATSEDGTFDRAKMKKLIRLFRPDREGKLGKIEFVKSCDTVYKSMRMLRASIKNAGQIDRAFETIINVIFYVVLLTLIVALLGYDPLALFLSLSSLVLAFAFMIGSASAKYFEGLLFILVRRPYGIGDRIALSDVNSDTSPNGSSTWFVQKVDLFTTTVRFATTNEVATLSNGSLAASRVINSKRSPQAVRYVYMKFSVDTPFKKVQVFKKAVENFVKDRPREWLAMAGFRATRVESDLGFIEYVIVVQHQEAWQNVGPILNSTADLASFCLELSKKLDMRYMAPPLPVNLAVKSGMGASPGDVTTADALSADGVESKQSKDDSLLSPDVRSLAAMFKHA